MTTNNAFKKRGQADNNVPADQDSTMMAPHGQQNHHQLNNHNGNDQQQIPDTDQEPPFMMDDDDGDDEMLHLNDLRDEDMAGDDIDEAQHQSNQMLNIDGEEDADRL